MESYISIDSLYITIFISSFLILIHLFFSEKNIFSHFNIFNTNKMLKHPKPNKIIVFDLDEKVMIYTNNQGPKSWVNMISTYFNNKIGYKLFDNIIAAFKISGKIVEYNRTSHDKSVEDLIRCTRINPNTEICFIDDQYHPLMNMDNVYYINVKPYYYSMPYEEMAEKYYNHQKDNMTVKKEEFITYILNYMNQYNYPIKNKSEDETELDKIISKKIVIHLEEFFKKSKKQNTRKRKNVKNRLTKRKF